MCTLHLRILAFLLLSILPCHAGFSKWKTKPTTTTTTTFLGLPEDDVQVIWNSETPLPLRRGIRSPEASAEEEGSGSGRGSALGVEFEDEGSSSGSGGEDEGSGSGSGDGDSDIENIYAPYWNGIKCSDYPLVLNSMATTGNGGYLPPNYNRLEIPQQKVAGDADDQKVSVWLYAGIQSISEIDEAKGAITLDMDATIDWWDDFLFEYTLPRLKCTGMKYDDVFMEKKKVLDPEFLHIIWKPDVFVDKLVNVKRPQLLVPPTRLQFSSNGDITYTARVQLKVKCDFTFFFYPADTQKCDVVFRSYSHNASVLGLKWHNLEKEVGAHLFDVTNDNFDVAIGSLERYRLVPGGRVDPSNETFDCLKLTVSARRKLSYHLIQTYVPSMLYVAITWLCFMVPRSKIEARLAITMTTLLSLTSMFASVRASTPAVSYPKAIDIWMVTGITFIFTILLHFTLLLWTETRKHEEEDKARARERERQRNDAPAVFKEARGRSRDPTSREDFEQQLMKVVLEKSITIVEFIEAHSFSLILSVFLVFNVFYWSVLLYWSEYFRWTADRTYNAVDPASDNFIDKYPYV